MKITEFILKITNNNTKEKTQELHNINDEIIIDTNNNRYMVIVKAPENYYIWDPSSLYSASIELCMRYDREELKNYELILIDEYNEKVREYEEKQRLIQEQEELERKRQEEAEEMEKENDN